MTGGSVGMAAGDVLLVLGHRAGDRGAVNLDAL